MRICFLMEPPTSQASVTYEVLAGLTRGGASVEVVTAASGLIDLERFSFEYDLYLFKSHSSLAESLAAAAHHRGATLLNAYPATMKVRDKIVTSASLLLAGIPTPRTFVTHRLEDLRAVVRDTPIVVKPHRGRRGEGIEVCMDEARFDDLLSRHNGHGAVPEATVPADSSPAGEALIFAQEFLEHEPYDYKAYAIGTHVHAIKRVFPARTQAEKSGIPVGDDPELVEVVRQCGELFGLELYGVDLVRTSTGFSVIEVNCFPGYKGVPEGGVRLSQFILKRCAQHLGLRSSRSQASRWSSV